MNKTDIDSFFNDESTQGQVNQPNEENSSQEATESSNDDLEFTSNSENQGENQNQGEKDQEKTETPTVEKKKDWSQQNEFKGYLDEKEKRQKLEKELESLKAKISQSEKVKKPDALDDPEAAIKYSQDQLEQQIWSQKVGLSESILKSMGGKFSDYDEKRSLFMDLAKDDPSLAQKLRNSDNPALFAYETATNHLKVEEFSNPDYEKNLREQIKKEILDEMSKSKQTSNNSLPVVKGTSLTNATGSKNSNTNPSKNPLDEIFKDHHLG